MNEEDKESILHDLNIKIGGDINDLSNAYELENKLVSKRKEIQSQVSFTYLLLNTNYSITYTLQKI